MESAFVALGAVLVLFALYRVLSRKFATPQATVRALLRRHHSLQRLGLSERDCLYRLLTSRGGWRNLPAEFIADLVARLDSKEDVFRFVSFAEEHRFHATQLPAITRNRDGEAAMREVALWLAAFGKRLQAEERYKEAEFLQKLAVRLQPEEQFTLLPLAATYYKTERYADAAALFRQGFARPHDPRAHAVMDSRADYEDMHAACAKIMARNQDSGP